MMRMESAIKSAMAQEAAHAPALSAGCSSCLAGTFPAPRARASIAYHRTFNPSQTRFSMSFMEVMAGAPDCHIYLNLREKFHAFVAHCQLAVAHTRRRPAVLALLSLSGAQPRDNVQYHD